MEQWRRWGAAAAPPSGTPSAAPLPASLFLASARDARPALIAIGSRDGGRPAAATEPAASMSLVRRTCGAGSSTSRPRIAPRRAGCWRRWRRPGRGRRSWRRATSRPSILTSRRPTSACGVADARSRQRDAGAEDGRRERPERPAGGEPRPARREAQRPVTTGRRPEAAEGALRGLSPVGRIR